MTLPDRYFLGGWAVVIMLSPLFMMTGWMPAVTIVIMLLAYIAMRIHMWFQMRRHKPGRGVLV